MKTKQALLVRTNGECVILEKKPDLEEAQALVAPVSGIVEMVRPRGKFNGHVVQMICDEEGLLRGAPVLNRIATALYQGKDVDIGDLTQPDIKLGKIVIGPQPRITYLTVVGDVIIMTGYRWG